MFFITEKCSTKVGSYFGFRTFFRIFATRKTIKPKGNRMDDYGCDVLVPERGHRICGLVIDALRSQGLRCEDMDACDVFWDEFGYIRLLKRRISECRPRMIMPVFRSEFIARHREELPRDIIYPFDSAEKIHRLDDKVSASALCTELGIPQPRMYADDEVGEIKQFPVVFKRSSGLNGTGIYMPRTEEALRKLIASSGNKGHLVMDFVEGYDCCVDAVRWGNFFHAEAYRVLLQKKRGLSVIRRTVKAPALVEWVRRILDEVDYQGVCGADFRVERETGKAYFLECNPRFSGGLRSQLGAGFNQPFILYQLASGMKPDEVHFHRGRFSCEWDDLRTLLLRR